MSRLSDSERPLLRVRAAAVSYRADRPALRDVSFDLEPAGSLGICGESGSGKSTLLRALLGLVPLSSGEVCWRGRSLAQRGRWNPRRSPLAGPSPRRSTSLASLLCSRPMCLASSGFRRWVGRGSEPRKV